MKEILLYSGIIISSICITGLIFLLYRYIWSSDFLAGESKGEKIGMTFGISLTLGLIATMIGSLL